MPKAAKKHQKPINSCEIGRVALFHNFLGKVQFLFSILFLTSFSCLLLNFPYVLRLKNVPVTGQIQHGNFEMPSFQKCFTIKKFL